MGEGSRHVDGPARGRAGFIDWAGALSYRSCGQPAAAMTREKLAGVLPRAALDTGVALEQIRPVCEDVRDRGAAAVREYTARFDGVDLPTSRVPARELAGALTGLDPELRAALEEMARRVRLVHEPQRPAGHVTAIADGARVTERYVAVSRAGVYV